MVLYAMRVVVLSVVSKPEMFSSGLTSAPAEHTKNTHSTQPPWPGRVVCVAACCFANAVYHCVVVCAAESIGGLHDALVALSADGCGH
jgi:hypothetical protein